MKKTKKLVDGRFAKGEMYKGVIKEITKAKVCPFCPKHFKWHTKPILRRHKGWLITENFNPYPGAQNHLLIIGTKHQESFRDIRPADWKTISELVQWALRKFKIKGGGLVMRFGDSLYTGATVTHLHLHLIVPKIKGGRTETVNFPIG
ncbi:MAG: HIT domain-containing protein [Anaplasmataceae bacterium]|nr:HIT domain-containing protein [Anaplasmataceae bacterium]